MTTKESLIKDLKNEIDSALYYKRDSIAYLDYCTIEQGEAFLNKLRNGFFDQIFASSSNVRLDALCKFDLSRTNGDVPTIKEFRKFVFLHEIDKNIKELDNGYTKEEKEKIINRYKHFLSNMNASIYDELLDKKPYWFSEDIKLDVLAFWDELREKTGINNSLTIANYAVIAAYYKVINNIEWLTRYERNNGKGYYISSSCEYQTPITKEEQEALEPIEKEVMSNNYNWREARRIMSKTNRLNMNSSSKFPHNTDAIIFCFENDCKTAYVNYDSNFSCNHNVDVIAERAKKLADELSPQNIYSLFLNRNEDDIVAYLRKMIVSQYDCSFLKSHYYSASKIKDILNNPSAYSEDELREFVSEYKNDRVLAETLYDIAYGTLYSLFNYTGHKINLLDDCETLQEKLNCNRGKVRGYGINTIRLPNGKTIGSLYSEDIDEYYSFYQEGYDFFCDNSSSDLEFVENCAEVLGDVVTSQIFLEGNKRTAKCLFNAMLMSNGIVPPIIDFNDKDLGLFVSFAGNRSQYYLEAKKMILDEAINSKNYFINESMMNKAT